jgi:hypothetical protein
MQPWINDGRPANRTKLESGMPSSRIQRPNQRKLLRSHAMNRYEITGPRKTFVVGAFAMMVLTLGAAIAPAGLESKASAPPVAVQRAVDARDATEVAIIPARIEVIGTRSSQTVFGAVRQFFARKVQAG